MEFDLEKTYGTQFDQTIKRIMGHPGVLGVIVTQNQRQPIFTNMDNNKTFLFANRLADFREFVDHTVRSIDPEDELLVMRIKTSKYEIMSVFPNKTQSIVAVQTTKD